MDQQQDHLPALPTRVAFTGGMPPLFRLTAKNAIFGLLTLNLYRFWGRTYLRQFFWGHTEITDEPLEYSGTPWLMFLGFLRFLVLFVVLSLIVNGLELMATANIALAGITGTLGTGLFLWFYDFARFGRLRFLLRHTSWRGIRPVLKNSAATYATKSLICQIINVLTLFLALPATTAYLEKVKLESIMIGNRSVSLKVDAGDLYPIFLRAIGLFFLLIFMAGILVFTVGFSLSDITSGLRASETNSGSGASFPDIMIIFVVTIYFGFAAMFLTPFIYYRVKVLSVLMSRLEVAGVDIEWSFEHAGLLKRYLSLAWKFALAFLVIGAVGSFIPGFSGLLTFIAFPAVFIGFLFKPYLWDVHVWRTVFEGLEFKNMLQLEEVRQSVEADGNIMDGFEDGEFDMAGF